MATRPDDLKARLEDRADLLEATRLRYRALKGVLESFFWKDRTRNHFELLREVAAAQPEVDATLAALRRRVEAEGWPRDAAPVRLMHEVERLREAVERAAERRLSSSSDDEAEGVPATLGERLLRLETEVLDAAPFLGGRVWAQAVELLPRNLPELRAACAAGEVFERVFKRPVTEGAPAFSDDEARELARALPLGAAALVALWERLERYDSRGRVKDFLQRRMRRAPTRVARSGPELLLHAAFWHDVARVRVRAVLEAELAPVVPREPELPALLSWRAALSEDPALRLSARSVFTEGRAGLVETAAALAALSRERPRGAWSEEVAWARLEQAAQRARTEEGPEAEALRDALRLFVMLRGQARTPARLFSPERAKPAVGDVARNGDLVALVQAARHAALRQGG
ncbi:hypothetical protein D7W79_12300 [Corallococcus exercitus]|uniref:Uncharacterized protein n=1 Tax=Corallococcus exercitus TaxID=2316736 RepID=A0A3A8IMR6_9BACT|nr:hypothetical protein [Corallococcus exercitus]NOK36065.1 hypothetical protein [Corallococcus exercitus]RKG78663.1 hypothetical protein D7W79_12300 [Corallococcus exercitus]